MTRASRAKNLGADHALVTGSVLCINDQSREQ